MLGQAAQGAIGETLRALAEGAGRGEERRDRPRPVCRGEVERRQLDQRLGDEVRVRRSGEALDGLHLERDGPPQAALVAPEARAESIEPRLFEWIGRRGDVIGGPVERAVRALEIGLQAVRDAERPPGPRLRLLDDAGASGGVERPEERQGKLRELAARRLAL